jgi:hypothetical protein
VFEDKPLWLSEKPLGLSEKPFLLRLKPFRLSLSKPLRALRQAQCERGCGPVMHRLLVSMHTVARVD